jgi:hypothetical protein
VGDEDRKSDEEVKTSNDNRKSDEENRTSNNDDRKLPPVMKNSPSETDYIFVEDSVSPFRMEHASQTILLIRSQSPAQSLAQSPTKRVREQ